MNYRDDPGLGSFSLARTDFGADQTEIHEKFEASGRAADQAVVVPDALLLFGGDYRRSGNDLILSKDGREFTALDYFKTGKRPDLTTSDGAVLSSKIVEALTGHVQYAQATAADPPKVIGQVSKLTGTATAIRNGVSVELNVGENVLKGDILQSGGGSSVTVTFVDGTVFGLGANARMALTEMVYDPNSSSNSSLLSLIQGTITFVAGETAKRGDMRVETPVATMGIRGTAVLVEIGFQITSATAPPVNFQVLVEPNGTTGSFVLYSRSNPNQIIGTVNQAGVVTAVTATGNVSVAAAPPLPPEAAAIIQQTLQTYFPTYVPPTDPNANPNAPGNNNNNNPAAPTDPNRAPDQGTPTNRTDNPNPQSAPTRTATGSAPPPTATSGSTGTVLSPTANSSLLIETGETVTRPVTIVDAAVGTGSTGTITPTTRTVEVTITRFNSAPVIEVHDVQNAQQFRIGDQVTITDADAADPAFNDAATPYVANTAVVTSVEAPATAPPQTELVALVSIDQTTGAVSYDPRQFAFLGPNQAVTYNISFQSRSGPDTVSQSLRLTVNGVNDAPDLTQVALELGEGQAVVLTADNIGVTDPDSTQFTFSVSEVSHGTVQRLSTGGIWQTVTSFTSADLAAAHVRFVHDGSELAPSFRVSVSDGSANGVPVLAEVSFSNQNDAPQLEQQSPALTTISVAETANHGQRVADIVAGGISDPDANALQGIAITGADVSSTNGTWQFSLDGGATWTNFATYALSSALLLAATDFVRFVPDGTATGAPSFTFFAWDQTSGVRGTVVDASVRGGTSALSAQSDTAELTVTERVGMTVTGDGGANDLAGGEFADTLLGLGGNDRLVGYQGGDLMDGGAGRDIADYHYFRYDQATQTVVPVNSGANLPAPTSGINVSLAQGTVIGDATVGTDTLRSVEYVRGTHLADSFDATGFGTGSLNVSSVNNLFNNGFEGYEGNDTIVGNGGTQLIYTHAEAGVTVDLQAGTAQGTAPGDVANVGVDTFTGVGAVRGSDYDDTLLGSNSTSRTDIFNGGAGNDLIDGRGGYDLAVYSSALDNFVTSGVQINLALGTVVATNPLDTSVGSDALRSVEAVRGTTFDDTFDATGFSGASVNAGSSGTFNEFEGVGGNDLVIGNGNTRLSFNNALAGVTVDIVGGAGTGTAQSTDANDAAGVGVDTFSGVNSLRGSNFDDRLLGSNNPSGTNESYYGGSGNDFIDGRGGFDRALYSFTSDDPGTGGINVTMASGIVSGDASVGTDTLRGIEAIRGTNFNDVYDASGFGGSSVNAGAFGTFNEIEGMSGNDTIIGNSNTRIAFYNATSNNGVTGVTVNLATGTASGNSSVGTDMIVGGVNAVYGSVFADTITGAAGSETFTGSGGNDTIDGGGTTAADLAVYLGASTEYTITQLGPNQYRVQDNVANRDGTDVVTNVEVLQFTDRALLLSSGSLPSPVNISGVSLTTTTPLVSATGSADDFVAVGNNIFGHQVDLGAGTGDTVSLAATGGYTLSLLNVENVRGTSGDDFVQLSANANGLAVDLGTGNDSLNLAIGTNSITVQNVEQIGSSDFSGTASDDSLTLLNTVNGVTINLGQGNNSLSLAAGTNVFTGFGLSAITGSASADSLNVTNGLQNTAVDLSGGDDTINVTSAFTSVGLSNVEHVVGDTQNNSVILQNTQNGLTVDLGAGIDNLTLANGTNTLSVSNVEQIIGSDFTGTASDDTLTLNNNVSGLSVNLQQGTNTLNLAAGANGLVDVFVQRINGTSGDDAITVAGNVFGATIDLGAGTDSLALGNPTGSSVTVRDVETVTGGAGADNITITHASPSGTTTVTAGLGNDNITASAQSDVIRYTSAAESSATGLQDQVFGFDASQDVFRFSNMYGVPNGFTGQFHFIGSANFSGSGSEARLNGNILQIDVDGNGFGANDIQLTVSFSSPATLTDANFVVDSAPTQPVVGPTDSNAGPNTVAEGVATGTQVGITALATDADVGATISYSLSDNAGGRFAINATTGVVTVANGALLDYETATSHDITVLATSSDGATGSQTFTINVTNVNDNPVAGPTDANGAANTVAEGVATGTQVGITALATDADVGATISYSLSDNAGGRFAINATTGVVTVANGSLLDSEVATSHNITVLATSSDGSINSQTFSVSVANVNDSPVVGPTDNNAAANTVAEGVANGTLVGITALATDADVGATVSYSLSDNAGGRFAINATTGVVTVANGTLLDFEAATSHNITVLATSSDGSTNSQTFTIGVTNVSDNPVVGPTDANGAANTVAEGAATGTLVGITAQATDADVGATISYTLSDNAGGRFAINATTGVVTVANGALLDYEVATSHNITVLATSSDGSSNSQTFTIGVTNVNDNPVVGPTDNNAAANTVAEGAANGTLVGITALATDADAGATISYSLSDNAGGRFAINATTGVVTVANGTLLDFETATSHDITVLATSSDGSSSSQTFTISVSNASDNPVVGPTDNNAAANAVAEGAANGTLVGITALATDADVGTTISYALSDNAGGRFAINATTGVVTVANGSLLDYEAATSHDITILATSSDGSTNNQTFTINVTNVSDNPVVGPTDNNAAANTVAEGSTNGTLVGITALATDADAGATISYTLSDNAGGRFAINAATGIVTVANGALLDYETATSHNITVLATSTDGSSNSQTFAIGVTNVNDNPVIGPADNNAAANTVVEGAANGTLVGITALANDADAGATISYSLSDNAGGRFTINASTGVVTVANGALLDYETATSHNITVLATSSDGSTNSQTFTVNVTNAGDNPVVGPTDNDAGANAVVENAANGALVGITALATDADAGTTISYSLSDNAGGRFAINASTGVVTVANGALLDYEAATSHNITVLATSSDGSSNSQTFTVSLIDEDNQVNGTSGADTFQNTASEDTFNGAGASDLVVYSNATAGITVALDAGIVTGDAAFHRDILRSVEQVRGTAFVDLFDATGFTTTSANASSIATSGRFSSLVTNTFEGEGGNDQIIGNGNTAISYRHATGGVIVDLQAGTASGDASVGADTFSGVNSVRGSELNDTLSGRTDATRIDIFTPGAGNDTVDGRAGYDLVIFNTDTAGLVHGVNVNLTAGTAADLFTTDPLDTVAAIGNDTLISIESVRGTNFNDRFTATGFNSGSLGTYNEFEGLGGNDEITGNGNTTVIYGNTAASADGTSGVTVDLRDGVADGETIGHDTLSGANGIVGSDYNDFLYGSDTTATTETFSSRGGDDWIDGRGGFDRALYSSTIQDRGANGVVINLAAGTVAGGATYGNDTLRGIEAVRGSNFNDTFDATGFGLNSQNANIGSSGTFNEFEGMDGDDTIISNGNTRIAFYNALAGVTVDLQAGSAVSSEAVNDPLSDNAAIGRDTITGVNQIVGSGFGDTLLGSNNTATFSFEEYDGRGGNDTFNGRGGFDRAIYNNDGSITSGLGINVDMAAGTVTSSQTAIGNDTLISIEAIRGTNRDDTYTATGYSSGSFGNFNEFEGMGGNDVVTGNGNTRLVFYNAGAAVTVDIAAGTATGATIGNDTFTGVNALRGSGANDTLRGSDNANGTTESFVGRGGNDTIEGRGGFDQVLYNTDTATFSGVEINMTLGRVRSVNLANPDGSIGVDTLRGIEQIVGTNFADVYHAEDTAEAGDEGGFGASGQDASTHNVGSFGTFNAFDGAGGNDTITGNGNTQIMYSSATAGVTVTLANGAGTATGDVSVGMDTITGGINNVYGSSFNDTFTGGATSETFTGAGGDDSINGGGTTAADVATFRGLRAEYTIQPHPTISGSYLIIDTVSGRDGTDTLTNVELLQFSDVTLLLPSTTAVDVSQVFFNGSLSAYAGTNNDYLIIGQGLFNRSIDLGNGVDTVGLAAAGGYGLNIFNVENVAGSGGDDIVSLVNNANGLSVDLGAGNDVLNLANGTNVFGSVANVEQINGSDFAVGQTSNDVLTFGSTVSNLSLNLGNGSNTLNLAAGANSFNTLGNANIINGTAGADTLTINSGIFSSDNNPIVNLGDGSDTVVVGASFARFNLVGVEALQGNGSNNFVQLAGTVTGLAVNLGGGSDSLDLANGSNSISVTGAVSIGTADFNGAASNDTLTLLSTVTGVSVNLQQGTNTLNLAAGTNSFVNLGNVNLINGTDSADILTIDNGPYAANNNPVLNLGLGSDTLNIGSQFGQFNLIGVEQLNGNALENNFTLTGLVNGLTIDLGVGVNDTLNLASGTNTIGLVGVERVNGSDFGVATPVNDTLNLTNAVSGVTIHLGNGTNTLNLAAGASSFNELWVQNVNGTASDETVTITGQFYAGIAVDLGDGVDTLNLNNSGPTSVTVRNVELVNGTAGNDNIVIANVDGDTVVAGGLGGDVITASAGHDVIRYAAAAQSGLGGTHDQIIGFNAAVDQFAFTGMYGVPGGFVSTISFIGSGTFSGLRSEARLSGNNLQIDVNGDGNLDANDMEIELVGLTGTLTNSNFIVSLVTGDNGGNTLNGTSASDAMFGFAGNDTFNAGDGANDSVDYRTATAGISVNLAAGVVTGDASVGTDTLLSVEIVRGTDYADTYDATGFWTGLGATSTNLGSPSLAGGVNNAFLGNDGNDTIIGNGRTTAAYQSATAGVTVTLSSFTTGGSPVAINGSAFSTAGGNAASIGTDTLINVFWVRGSEYADVLNGGVRNDVFTGGGGNDAINGAGGFDLAVYAPGTSDNTTGGINIDMASGVVTGDASIGTDTLRSIESVRGTIWNDTYVATNFGASGFLNTTLNNVGNSGTFNEFEGMGGNDTITGNGNTRILYANAGGAVTVNLDTHSATGDLSVGTDTLAGIITGVRGSSFNDTLIGSNSNGGTNNYVEEFDGWAGNDFINGGDGFDQVTYANNSVTAAGISVNMTTGVVVGDSSIGTDTLRSIEQVYGTAFADTYNATGFGASGLDPLTNNVANNGTFNSFQGNGGNDTITGNGNTRIVYFSATAGVTVDLAAGTATGDASVGTDTIVSGVANVAGSAFVDNLLGSDSLAVTEELDGRAGNDVLNGRGGFDRAVYNADASVTSGIVVNMAAGTVDGGANVDDDTLLSIEAVRGTNFNDSYTATGFGSSSTNAGSNGTFNEFEGMGGNDTIVGNGNTRLSFVNSSAAVVVSILNGTASGSTIGSDTFSGVNAIRGSNSADDISGSDNASGTEVFDGRRGNDTINGNGGFDQATYFNDSGITSGVTVNMGAGTVTGDATVGTDTLRSIEQVYGTNFADSYDASTFGTGGALNVGSNGTFNSFQGNGGNDTVIGNGNTQIVFFNATAGVSVNLAGGTVSGDSSVGSDTVSGINNVTGSNFNDTITGGGANETLNGGTGNDTINGGAGNDTLTGGGGQDQFVFDANHGQDVITDFATSLVPNSDVIELVYESGAMDFTTWLNTYVEDSANGATIYSDANHALAGQATILLQGIARNQLTQNDFIFGPSI